MARGPDEILRIASFIKDAEIALKKSGVATHGYSSDFREFIRTAREDDRVRAPMHFDPAHVSQLNYRGSWLWCKDASGKLIHIQAYRIDDLKAGTLGEYLDWFLPSIDWGKVSGPQGVLEGITGTAVYSGAAWTHDDFRANDLACCASRLTHAIIELTISPDFIYGFMDTSVNRMARRMGFGTLKPLYDWVSPPDCALDADICVSSREDREMMFQAGHARFARQSGKTPETHPQEG